MAIVTNAQVDTYWNLFVNRPDYARQSFVAGSKGKHSYYRAVNRVSRMPIALTKREVQEHLQGVITLGLYNLSREATAKWLAIDADYADSLADLLLLQQRFSKDGVTSLIEESRRGGHLWIFASEPLKALPARVYLHTRAIELGLPIKSIRRPDGTFPVDGLEIYPKQSFLSQGEYGGSLRGPFGVHRATQLRYWYTDAPKTLPAQIELLAHTPKLTPGALSSLAKDLPIPGELLPLPAAPVVLPKGLSDRIFRITEVLSITPQTKRVSGNYVLRCPSCAAEGRDRSGDNLHIKINEPLKYQCRSGCTSTQIRSALGRPRRNY
jgi:hypothetical protein